MAYSPGKNHPVNFGNDDTVYWGSEMGLPGAGHPKLLAGCSEWGLNTHINEGEKSPYK